MSENSMCLEQKIIEEKIIAILRLVPDDKLINTAEALYKGGIRLLEVTVNQKSKTPEADNARQIKMLCDYFGNKMTIGAGTVMTLPQAESAINAGAKFILAPSTNEDVIKYIVSRDVDAIPGALTPTEIANAMQWGAKIVKLFPAGNMGLDYIKAIKAPISNAKLIAVGGVDENNIMDFINAGTIGCGIGSNIANMKYINTGNFDKITELAKKFKDAVKGE